MAVKTFDTPLALTPDNAKLDPKLTEIGGNTLVRTTADEQERGVFGQHPAMFPRYTENTGSDADKNARFFVYVENKSALEQYKALMAKGNADVLKVLDKLVGYPKGGGFGYVDFLLTSVTETFDEKVQIVEVLSDQYIAYFFGQRPMILRMSGVLYNTIQDDWSSAFSIMYNAALRGTRMAEAGRISFLSYDSRLVAGVLLNFTQNMNADMQMGTTFTCDFLTKRFEVNLHKDWKPTQLSNSTDMAGRVLEQFKEQGVIQFVASSAGESRTGTVSDPVRTGPTAKEKLKAEGNS